MTMKAVVSVWKTPITNPDAPDHYFQFEGDDIERILQRISDEFVGLTAPRPRKLMIFIEKA